MSGRCQRVPNNTGKSSCNESKEHPPGSPVTDSEIGLPSGASLAINRALKQRRSAKQKSSIERKAPLKLSIQAKTQIDLQREHLTALLQAKEAASRLPKQSMYARHRMACIEKALFLLQNDR